MKKILYSLIGHYDVEKLPSVILFIYFQWVLTHSNNCMRFTALSFSN